MTTGSRRTHDFCWINLMSPNGESGRSFFADLFGWTYGDMPGVAGGSLIVVGGHTAGAFMDLDVVTMPGTPPAIFLMVKVEDADATVTKINALRGYAKPAFDVMTNGRMAECADPNGAVFAIWQPKDKDGIDADSHAHGAPSWFETPTSDVGRAAKFYAAVFGWTPEEQPMLGMTYTVFKLGNVPIGGAMPVGPQMKGVAPHWSTYFAVTSAAETARLGVELGATLCMPVQEIPGVGRMATLESPQGVPFQVIDYKR